MPAYLMQTKALRANESQMLERFAKAAASKLDELEGALS
jgi:hypothetical protein